MPKMIRFYSENKGEHTECRKGSKKAKELHTCPYRGDIHGDYETLCDCSPEQERQCADDI